MAYLLLWSSIERYVSLRYHFGGKVKPKVDQLQNEPAFADSLKIYVRQDRIGDKVYRADRPNQKEVLAPESPGKDIDYYHQIRSNIIHRGKAAIKDHNRILHSRDELTHIFKRVLEATRSDAMP